MGKVFKINVVKIKSFEDVVNIIGALDIVVPENFEGLPLIRHLCDSYVEKEVTQTVLVKEEEETEEDLSTPFDDVEEDILDVAEMSSGDDIEEMRIPHRCLFDE